MDFKKFREFEDYLSDGDFVKWEGHLCKVEKNKAGSAAINLRSVVEPYPKLAEIDSILIGMEIKLRDEYLKKFGFEEDEEAKNDGIKKLKKDNLTLIEYTYCFEENGALIGGGIEKLCIYDEELQKGKFNAVDLAEKSKSISTIHALQNYLKDNPKKANIDFDLIVPQLKIY